MGYCRHRIPCSRARYRKRCGMRTSDRACRGEGRYARSCRCNSASTPTADAADTDTTLPVGGSRTQSIPKPYLFLTGRRRAYYSRVKRLRSRPRLPPDIVPQSRARRVAPLLSERSSHATAEVRGHTPARQFYTANRQTVCFSNGWRLSRCSPRADHQPGETCEKMRCRQSASS